MKMRILRIMGAYDLFVRDTMEGESEAGIRQEVIINRSETIKNAGVLWYRAELGQWRC